jgi:hypothetical protein
METLFRLASHLSQMGYALAWCIEAINKSKSRALERSQASRSVREEERLISDDDYDEEDEVNETIWLEVAANWLVQNAPMSS